MRAYFKPGKVHPICLYLTAGEATQLLGELDPLPVESGNLMLFKARLMVGRAVHETESHGCSE